jgi:hypothetical protein
MQIATEHPEAVRQRSRMGVEERLFLHRVALGAARVPPRDPQPATLVEPDLADAKGAIGNAAVVPACIAMHPLTVE